MKHFHGFTHHYLSSLFAYDSKTGIVTAKVSRGSRVRVGDPVGRENGNGYLRLGLEGKTMYVHRLAYFLHHGECPAEVDHRDLNRKNNRIRNLRAAAHSHNMANGKKRAHNTSGFKGVHLHKASGLWKAEIKVNYEKVNLGYFRAPGKAHAAYKTAAKKFFGEFARA